MGFGFARLAPEKGAAMARPRRTIDQVRTEILSSAGVSPNGCWEWMRAINNNGYARLQALEISSTQYAHRIAYLVFTGPIPEDRELDHLCRNRRCVNPRHLEVVRHAENLRRGRHHNGNKTHCIHGHAFVQENIYWRKNNRGRQCKRCTEDRYQARR